MSTLDWLTQSLCVIVADHHFKANLHTLRARVVSWYHLPTMLFKHSQAMPFIR